MKAGILGGGQLGRMLLQAGANYPVETWVLESDPECPAAGLAHRFVEGDIRDFDAVYNFGKQLDVLTIEIESVNVEALEKLESEGLRVIPAPKALRVIQDKSLQKQFYAEKSIPSPAFHTTAGRQDVASLEFFLPAVHKLARGGYDGKGVRVLQGREDIAEAFDAPAVLEKRVDIKKEVSIVIASDGKGKHAIYPASEMMVDPVRNLLDFQLSPAALPQKVLWKAEAIALAVARELGGPGIFAVELFIDQNDDVFVNETAPRVHNSGHHTIEGNFCSQYDMLWRIMLGYPLGNPAAIMPASLVNLVGAEDSRSGPTAYEGLDEVLQMDNTFVHLYGKQTCKPGRKMGHVTILSNERQELLHRAGRVRQTLKVRGSDDLSSLSNEA